MKDILISSSHVLAHDVLLSPSLSLAHTHTHIATTLSFLLSEETVTALLPRPHMRQANPLHPMESHPHLKALLPRLVRPDNRLLLWKQKRKLQK